MTTRPRRSVAMVGGVFACPECGGEVDVPGLTPGRQVVCARCATLVEVPFLRRRRHGRRGRRSEVYTLLMLGGGLAAVVVAGAIAWAVLAARERAGHRRAFDELAEASRRAEASGRAEDALRDSLAALELARRTKLEGSFVDELREHRDVLAVREIRARLAALDSAEPRAALGEALTLQRRTVIDAAISDYAAAADEAVARARLRVIAAELEAAREAVSGERPAEAIAACERLLEAAEASSAPEAGSARTEALAIATGIATRFGMIVEPTKGRFTLGSPQGFTKAFGDALGDALRARGFLLPPRSPALVQVWSTAAPYHFVVDVIEKVGMRYAQSVNRTAMIEAKLSVIEGGTIYWTGVVQGKTRTPPKGISPYEDSRISTSRTADPAVERKLYNDALDSTVEQAIFKLRGLPKPNR